MILDFIRYTWVYHDSCILYILQLLWLFAFNSKIELLVINNQREGWCLIVFTDIFKKSYIFIWKNYTFFENSCNNKYKRQIFNEFKIELFDNVEYVSWGHVLITNRSNGYYLRKNNKPEQITVYACYNNNKLYCFAILRCDDYIIYNNNRNYKTKKLYQNKILFLIPGKRSDLKTFGHVQNKNNKKYICCEFKSYISSDGNLYRIIFKDYITLFDNLSNFFNLLITDSIYNIKTEGPPLVYKPQNRNISVFSKWN